MLYGLLAVLIPILIHLFNFRRYKKLYFSNIQFLKNITQETRKQNKLKHLVVLALRMGAIIAMVLAFSDPEWRDANNKMGSSVGEVSFIYIDNSFSMRATGNAGRLFEQAVNDAKKLVNEAQREHRFFLLHNEFGMSQSRLLSREIALNELDGLKISPVNRKLSTVTAAMQKQAEKQQLDSWNAFVFSDFQKTTADLDALASDTVGSFYFILSQQLQGRNIFIDSCWVDHPVMIPGKRGQLHVKLSNAADVDYEKVPLQLSIDGQKKAVAGLDLKANSEAVVVMDFSFGEAGWHAGMLEIEDFPITFDDKLYFAFEVKPSIKVLEIFGEQASDEIHTFYQTDSIFDFSSLPYQRIDYNRINEFHLIILNELPVFSNGLQAQLLQFIEQGGNILFIPDPSSVENQNAFLRYLKAGSISGIEGGENRVVRIKTSSQLFRDAIKKVPENADFPVVNKYVSYAYSANAGLEPLVYMLNGEGFLFTKKVGAGNLYILSVPLDKSFGNFSSHALFIPIMYGAAISGNVNPSLYHEIGADQRIQLKGNPVSQEQHLLMIKERASDYSFIPGVESGNGNWQLSLYDAIRSDGFYELLQDSVLQHLFAFNYKRDESVMEFYTASELQIAMESGPLRYVQIMESDSGKVHEVINTMLKEPAFWKLFIIFALLILLTEVIILRIWK